MLENEFYDRKITCILLLDKALMKADKLSQEVKDLIEVLKI